MDPPFFFIVRERAEKRQRVATEPAPQPERRAAASTMASSPRPSFARPGPHETRHWEHLTGGADSVPADREECCICLESFDRRAGIECDAAPDSRHFACDECFAGFVRIDVAPETFPAADGSKACFGYRCRGSSSFGLAQIEAHLPAEEYLTYKTTAEALHERIEGWEQAWRRLERLERAGMEPQEPQPEPELERTAMDDASGSSMSVRARELRERQAANVVANRESRQHTARGDTLGASSRTLSTKDRAKMMQAQRSDSSHPPWTSEPDWALHGTLMGLQPKELVEWARQVGMEPEWDPAFKTSSIWTPDRSDDRDALVAAMLRIESPTLEKLRASADSVFLAKAGAADREATFPVVEMGERKYDVFINHCQGSGQDQSGSLARLLEARGATVWYDTQAQDLTAQGMEFGVSQSRNVLVFLSDDLMGRRFCQFEQRWGKLYGCNFVGVVETDSRHGAADFKKEKDRAPADLKHLLDEIHFIHYRRRAYEATAMVEELVRRCNINPTTSMLDALKFSIAEAVPPRSRLTAPTREEVQAWTVDDVCNWLVSLELPAGVIEKFRDNEVDNEELLDEALDWEQLLDQIGVKKPAHRKKIFDGMQLIPCLASVDWSTLLASSGSERQIALQAALDGWKPQRWVIAQEELGRGSSGAVFRSTDSGVGEAVAIKFSYSEEPHKLKREAALMKRAAHERVCKIYDPDPHVSNDGKLFGLVLELLDQGNLEARIKSSPDGRIHEFEVMQIGFDVLDALKFMHGKGVIHRDIKPANIMMTEVDGRLVSKLIDFSVSAMDEQSRAAASETLRGETTTIQRSEVLAGTSYYMSPEQFATGQTVTAQSDLWSLGVVFFEALSGVRPFAPGETEVFKISMAVQSADGPELNDVIYRNTYEVGVVTESMADFTRPDTALSDSRGDVSCVGKCRQRVAG